MSSSRVGSLCPCSLGPRNGSAGKCRIAPLIGSVPLVVTLACAPLSSVRAVAVDVTVPAVVVGGPGNVGSPSAEEVGDWRIGDMGRPVGDVGRLQTPSFEKTADKGGEPTSLTCSRRLRSAIEPACEAEREPELPLGPCECDFDEELLCVWYDGAVEPDDCMT